MVVFQGPFESLVHRVSPVWASPTLQACSCSPAFVAESGLLSRLSPLWPQHRTLVQESHAESPVDLKGVYGFRRIICISLTSAQCHTASSSYTLASPVADTAVCELKKRLSNIHMCHLKRACWSLAYSGFLHILFACLSATMWCKVHVFLPRGHLAADHDPWTPRRTDLLPMEAEYETDKRHAVGCLMEHKSGPLGTGCFEDYFCQEWPLASQS